MNRLSTHSTITSIFKKEEEAEEEEGEKEEKEEEEEEGGGGERERGEEEEEGGPILLSFVEFRCNQVHRNTGLNTHKHLLRLALANGSDIW
jgi:hypothetical protein